MPRVYTCLWEVKHGLYPIHVHDPISLVLQPFDSYRVFRMPSRNSVRMTASLSSFVTVFLRWRGDSVDSKS